MGFAAFRMRLLVNLSRDAAILLGFGCDSSRLQTSSVSRQGLVTHRHPVKPLWYARWCLKLDVSAWCEEG